MLIIYPAPVEEAPIMESAGFKWDPTCTGRTRWTHTETGVTALKQPYMRKCDWDAHLAEKIREAQNKSKGAQHATG